MFHFIHVLCTTVHTIRVVKEDGGVTFELHYNTD